MNAKPKPWWPRFRLRTALIVVGLLCIPLSQYPWFETAPGPAYVVRSYETSGGHHVTEMMSFSDEDTTDFSSPTPRFLAALAVDAALLIVWWMLTPSRKTVLDATS